MARYLLLVYFTLGVGTFSNTRMADIVLRLQQVKCALLLRKTTIIKEIRLLESVFPDRTSIFSPNLHSNYGNSAPVQFNP